MGGNILNGNIDAIFFDLDGTLTDPKLGICRSIQYALGRLNTEVPNIDQLTWCIGPPLLCSFEEILGDRNTAKQALIYYRERFAETGLYENRVYDGIAALLARLTQDGYELFIATSKPTVFASKICRHFQLSRYFRRIFGSELDGSNSSKVELLRNAADHLSVSSQRCVMVGDRSYDILGATENGMQSIGVLYGYGSRSELENAGATRFARMPHELVSAINKSQ